jgi:uncharacterized membrane protein
VRTSRGLDRLVAFLDAVVAIAITLLVLPLVEVLKDGPDQQPLHEVFSDNGGLFGGFLLSFVVIGRFWLAHHRIVERVGAYDSAFLLLNMAWILTIVFLPFATQVAADYGAHERLAIATYIGTMAASSVCLTALAVLVSRRAALRREDVDRQAADPHGAIITSGLLLTALALGVAVPRINYWAILLLLLSGPLEHQLRRRHEVQDAKSG